MSLYLQQVRGLSSPAAGLSFLPMMVSGALLTPFSARIAERLGARLLITCGLLLMMAGPVLLAVVASATPVWALALLMVLVGPAYGAGTASGVFNTSRKIGGALAVAVFGALLANQATFMQGLRASRCGEPSRTISLARTWQARAFLGITRSC